jgi:ribosome-binding protein aMBF1 (putative translation factor)
MPQTLDDFMQELEEEIRRAGPAAVAHADALKARYTLAADLIALRKRRGLTLRQLSARTGVQQSEISRIEGGRANPTLSTVAVLASALGADVRLVAGRRRSGRASVTVRRSVLAHRARGKAAR